MKEVLQARVYEKTKDMTTEERVAYINTPTDQPFFPVVEKPKNQITHSKKKYFSIVFLVNNKKVLFL